ncbi:hypothetical protein CALVIDRAFT_343037 [Calocera viscosa TUFC12733]|uniref:Uncharacterized protein n=1 Tax=Calocera viscosa (strain TUFC12733) TaxID=1330018 RepID=A0A167HFY0_CALVF|nr:hypothetical protein CALVIDRAFT_343037 [Calocera viscosa TUFC12733]
MFVRKCFSKHTTACFTSRLCRSDDIQPSNYSIRDSAVSTNVRCKRTAVVPTRWDRPATFRAAHAVMEVRQSTGATCPHLTLTTLTAFTRKSSEPTADRSHDRQSGARRSMRRGHPADRERSPNRLFPCYASKRKVHRTSADEGGDPRSR